MKPSVWQFIPIIGSWAAETRFIVYRTAYRVPVQKRSLLVVATMLKHLDGSRGSICQAVRSIPTRRVLILFNSGSRLPQKRNPNIALKQPSQLPDKSWRMGGPHVRGKCAEDKS